MSSVSLHMLQYNMHMFFFSFFTPLRGLGLTTIVINRGDVSHRREKLALGMTASPRRTNPPLAFFPAFPQKKNLLFEEEEFCSMIEVKHSDKKETRL